jgi:hypothetical protein
MARNQQFVAHINFDVSRFLERFKSTGNFSTAIYNQYLVNVRSARQSQRKDSRLLSSMWHGQTNFLRVFGHPPHPPSPRLPRTPHRTHAAPLHSEPSTAHPIPPDDRTPPYSRGHSWPEAALHPFKILSSRKSEDKRKTGEARSEKEGPREGDTGWKGGCQGDKIAKDWETAVEWGMCNVCLHTVKSPSVISI